MRAVAVLLIALAACGPQSNGAVDAPGSNDGKPPGDGVQTTDGPVQGSSQVSILVEPNGNDASELVSAISGAQQSIYMTMYEIDDTSVLDALATRARAGVDVEVVLDGSSTTKSFNTPAHDQLQSAGASVVWSSSSFTYTHEKCVIIDGSVAWIMTMNLNKSSPKYNREYLAIDRGAADIAEATAVFKADHALQSITPSGALVVANTNARQKLVQLIDSATSTLDLEGEEFSDNYSTGVTNAVARAAQRGVNVRVVLANSSPSSNQLQAISTIKNTGAHVVVTGPTSGSGTASNPFIHAKALVIDCSGSTCAGGYVGSENFSGGSLGYNRELGVIFSDPTQLAKVENTIAGDYARGTPQ